MKQDAPQTHLTFAMKYIRMSDMVFCDSNKEDLSEIIKSNSTAEFYAERLDVMNGFIVGSKKAKEIGDTIIKAFLIPLDTRIYNATSNSKLSIKDLISDKSNCTPDCTKLVAIEPSCWMDNLDKHNCLKQIHASLTQPHATNSLRKSYLAFECEWPDKNAEWLTRNRMHNWPEPEIVNYIKRNGCRVVPKCDPTCDCQLAEWQFTFDRAEQVISQHAVTEEQLDCFLVVKIALENILDEPLTLKQLKHVFFFVCEETDKTLWKTELAECVWIFLGRLKECVRSEYIPNYFMPHVNLLEGHAGEEYILHCTKCIDILQRHPFVLLYFMCDDYPHSLLEVNTLFDRLVEDCRRYSLHQNVNKSIRLCFLPIIAENISGLVRLNKYMKALEKCQVTTEKLNLHVPDGNKLHLEDVISKVILLSCDSLNQWLFAFVADQKLGTFCTETVCEGQNTVSIFSFYGPGLANNLRLQADDILIPLELVSLRYLAETTSYMLDILEEMCAPAVYREVLIFFLSNHLNQLVRSIRSNTTSATQRKYFTKVMNKMQLKISNDTKL